MSDERRTVLVVDDDPDILEIVTVVLDLYDVPAVTASDGVEALAAMRGSSELGLVLLDLMMPRMNGVDVIAAMKRDPTLATMPVVVISGNYHTEQAVLAMGADEYLLKPIDVDVLLHAVSRFVRVGRRSQQAADDGQRC
jgi:two-component system, chemotaxis family, chemotaxis protein CheY